MEDHKIFALDIGTRSVVGLILEQAGETYRVCDYLVKEHQVRAMHDGQIHDIAAVSQVITEIKTQLESTHGPLTKVCVAAAGRSLKTERARSAIPITGKPMMSQEDILYLELTAVQHAQIQAAEKQALNHAPSYYCVGYSVLHYFIDGEKIGNLIDQQGDEASVDIIATFLPQVVIDSLIKALTRAGLELDALTLEPIAAINVLVPVSMRRLNIALVDIGAGTSDIAITNEGTVVAYGMVPTAGDEITEAISDEYLLDFPDAEQAKKQLWDRNSMVIQDILGFESEISKADAISQISSAIDKLASEIATEIRQLNNGKPPKAVMLVGGGSKTPELPKRLAALLQLPENRVAIRGADAIQGLEFAADFPLGPENITPIGIAISARKSPIHYVNVTVNDRLIRLFEVNQLTIGDALLAAGIMINKLYGKPGLAKFITLNDQSLTIPGTYGEAPSLLKNGIAASVDDPIKTGDVITVEKGADGKPAEILIKDLIDEIPQPTAIINGITYEVPTVVLKNGKCTSWDAAITDRDEIKINVPKTIYELLTELQLKVIIDELQPFHLHINGKELMFPQLSNKLYLNGKVAKLSDRLTANIKLDIKKETSPTVEKIASLLDQKLNRTITVSFNGRPVTITKKAVEFVRAGQRLQANDELQSGDTIVCNEFEETDFIFQDVFNVVEVEKPEHASSHFTLMVNDEEATFYSPIKTGDRLDILWPVTSPL